MTEAEILRAAEREGEHQRIRAARYCRACHRPMPRLADGSWPDWLYDPAEFAGFARADIVRGLAVPALAEPGPSPEVRR